MDNKHLEISHSGIKMCLWLTNTNKSCQCAPTVLWEKGLFVIENILLSKSVRALIFCSKNVTV